MVYDCIQSSRKLCYKLLLGKLLNNIYVNNSFPTVYKVNYNNYKSVVALKYRNNTDPTRIILSWAMMCPTTYNIYNTTHENHMYTYKFPGR